MSEENNINVMGSEPISSIEVKEEATQDVVADDSNQQNKVPEAIPYDRFQQVNSEKNEYKQKYDELQGQISEYLRTHNATAQNNVDEEPVIEDIKDLTAYMDRKVQEYVAPLQQQQLQQNYNSNLENFFASDLKAKELKEEIDSYYRGLPENDRINIANAVASGNMSRLNEIRAFVAEQRNNNLQTMANEAVQGEVNKAFSPQATKVVRQGDPTPSDLIKKGKETGNFNDFFRTLANQI